MPVRLPDAQAVFGDQRPSGRSNRRIASFDITAGPEGERARALAEAGAGRTRSEAGYLEAGADLVDMQTAKVEGQEDAKAAQGIATEASYEAAGTRKIGEGLDNLGTGIGTVGRRLEQYLEKEEALNTTRAESIHLTNRINLDNKRSNDNEADGFAERWKPQYEENLKTSSELISNPRDREKFILKHTPDIAKSGFETDKRAFDLNRSKALGAALEEQDALRDTGLKATDEETRSKVVSLGHKRIDDLENAGYVDEVTARKMRLEWAEGYGTTFFRSIPAKEALSTLRGAPRNIEEYLDRTGGVESGDNPNARAKTSSALGVFQFTKGTWADQIARHKPEIAKGRSAAELINDPAVQALRSDPTLSRDLARTLTNENGAALREAGLPASPANLYLAHFLGAGDAVKVLKAASGTPVEGLVNGDSVRANSSILRGKTVDSIVAWASQKMGGSGRGAELAAALPEATKIKLRQEFAKQAESDTITEKAVIERSYTDALVSAKETGTAPLRPDVGQLVETYGSEEGERKSAEIDREIEAHQDRKQLSTFTPEEQARFVQAHKPDPNKENFAAENVRYVKLVQAQDTLQKEKDADPAAYVLKYSPATQDAFKKFTSTPNEGPQQKVAARHYAVVAEQEQRRLGVPPDKVAIVPQPYIDAMQAELNRPEKDGGHEKFAKKMQAYQETWGPAWGLIHKQLSKTAGSLITVLGTGVMPDAAMRLTELASVSTADVLKSVPETKKTQVQTEIAEAFLPFSKTVLVTSGGTKIMQDFIDQGTKYAASMVSMGADPTTAAQKSFNDLIGHKYDFRATYRVPKNAGVTPQAVDAGASAALRGIEKFDLMVPVDKVYRTGTTEAYRRQSYNSSLRANATWVTDPEGEEGLVLYYHNERVRKSDGTPLRLSWKELQTVSAGSQPSAPRHLLPTGREELQAFPR
jgi:hypothetical protein